MAQPAGQPRRRPHGQPRTKPGQPHGQPQTKPGQPQTKPGQPQTKPGRPRPGPARIDPARRAAYDVLRAVADRDAYANLLLPSLLRERGVTGRDAAFATELTYGTLRGLGTYDAILAACSDRPEMDPPVRDVLRIGVHQLLATRVSRHAAVATSVDLAKDACGPRPSGFVNAVLRRVATHDLDAWIDIVAPDRARDPSGHLAVRHSYPRWIADAYRDALAAPAETEEALAAGNVRPDVVLALRPASPPDAPDARHAPDAPPPDAPHAPDAADEPALPEGTRTRWSPYGFRLAGGDPAPLVASGLAAVQDEASQLAALALSRVGISGPDRLWLDLCAGPGGKARLLSGLAAERGARLVASDVRPHRARKILEALRRATPAGAAPAGAAPAGAAPAGAAPSDAVPSDAVPSDAVPSDAVPAGHHDAVLAADGRHVPWPPGTFDRVLADVPCSGLGSLRRRPEARWRKTPADVTALAGLQQELLDSAIESVRPGGVVAYVTCSPHVAETRDVVTAVAGRRGDVTILDAPAILPEVPGLRSPDSRFAQFWTHRHGTDAIFLALLRRE